MDAEVEADFERYLEQLRLLCDVTVVDGSEGTRAELRRARWARLVRVMHPDPRYAGANGEVTGAMTGIEAARHERVVVADDDVRYDRPRLSALVGALHDADRGPLPAVAGTTGPLPLGATSTGAGDGLHGQSREGMAGIPMGRARHHIHTTAGGGDMASTARDVMTAGAECVGENDTVTTAAERMASLDVGALPICGEDDRLKGMVTDRDIVLKVVARGKDPQQTSVGSLAEGEVVTIGADDSLDEARRTMERHQVRRLPVIDGHRLVGMVSQADLARSLADEDTGKLVESISQE